ncbi:MAG: hypothetical protein AABM40_14395 [Chloroflexota bacterium]
MGVQDLLSGYLKKLEPDVREILADVILAEQAVIDMDRPRVKEKIREIIDAQVRRGQRV